MSSFRNQNQSRGSESDDDNGYSAHGGDEGGFRVDYAGDGSDDSFSLSVFGRTITISQMPNDRVIGHGAVVWEAAVVFAKYMEYGSNKDLALSSLLGRTVLELGSGPGLGGMCMMLRGADVTLTDLACVTEALTFDNTRRFYKQLRSEGSGAMAGVPLLRPRVFSLDWTDEGGVATMLAQAAPVDSPGARSTPHPPGEMPESEPVVDPAADADVAASAAADVADDDADGTAGAAKTWAPLTAPFDVVLLTDCVFSVHLVPDLVRTIRQCTGPRSVVYCVHEIRDTDANAEFLRVLGLYFKLKMVDRRKQHPDYRHELVQILIAKPRRKLADDTE